MLTRSKAFIGRRFEQRKQVHTGGGTHHLRVANRSPTHQQLLKEGAHVRHLTNLHKHKHHSRRQGNIDITLVLTFAYTCIPTSLSENKHSRRW